MLMRWSAVASATCQTHPVHSARRGGASPAVRLRDVASTCAKRSPPRESATLILRLPGMFEFPLSSVRALDTEPPRAVVFKKEKLWVEVQRTLPSITHMMERPHRGSAGTRDAATSA